jgi:hypothetical protein
LGMSNAAAMPNIKTHYSLSRKRMWGLFLAIALSSLLEVVRQVANVGCGGGRIAVGRGRKAPADKPAAR